MVNEDPLTRIDRAAAITMTPWLGRRRTRRRLPPPNQTRTLRRQGHALGSASRARENDRKQMNAPKQVNASARCCSVFQNTRLTPIVPDS